MIEVGHIIFLSWEGILKYSEWTQGFESDFVL